MERLTEPTNDSFKYDLKDHTHKVGEFSTYDAFFNYSMAVKRLGEYEDTGLEPEQIIRARDTLGCFDEIGIKRGNEIVKAEQQGRLVVLPCRVGDTVFVNGEGRTMMCEIDEAHMDNVHGLEYLVSFSCKAAIEGTDVCKGCPFNSWRQEYSGEYSCDGEWGQGSIKGADFGKTVFLTREEAERALAPKTIPVRDLYDEEGGDVLGGESDGD